MSALLTKLNNFDKRLKQKETTLKPVLVAKEDENGWYTIDFFNKTFKSKRDMNKFLDKTYQDQKYVLIIDDIRKWD